LIVVNPTAGGIRSRRFAATLEALRDAGCELTLIETHARGDAERLARLATPARHDAVVIAGGDGTINEAINGIGELPLAVIPLGTANVLAAELGLPFSPPALARVIARAPPRSVHLGEANGRRFALMVGAGFDARVVEGVDLQVKRNVGKLAYWLSAAEQIALYRPLHYAVEIDGVMHRAASVIVAKGHYYGGRYVVAPEARLADPLLHVCLFERAGRGSVLRYGTALVAGRLARLPDVRVIAATAVRVTGPVGEAIHGDGDLLGALPASIGVSPRPLRVIA
jgi:YegS/Rv2252/BmrU family lipid kinase